MNAHEYILIKQIEWARNHGIALIGSKIDQGRPLYTTKLEENLFEPLSSSTQDYIESGDGGELTGYPAKMQALHSSSALGVNIFQYWAMGHEISNIAHIGRIGLEFVNEKTIAQADRQLLSLVKDLDIADETTTKFYIGYKDESDVWV